MKTREWIGDVRVEAEWSIYTGKRQWGIWIPVKFPSLYTPEANMEPCGTYPTRPEAMCEARKISKKRRKERERKEEEERSRIKDLIARGKLPDEFGNLRRTT